MTNYETIPNITNLEHSDAAAVHMETGATSDETVGMMNGMIRKTKISRGLALLMGGIGVIAACMLLLGGSSSNNGAATTTSMALEGMTATTSAARACTLAECFASSCNHEVAPYTCLRHNGGPHGGCSPIEWTKASCTEQCDLSGCDDIDIPDDTPSCEKACTKEWCKAGSCGGDVGYTCTSGAARYGCSADALQWTLRTSSDTCSACCDASLC
mmetsp:Transcript_11724/g.19489  ORF Transcript_11724/g.19489 Transcript_11724/m.19489 type:complete len:214 (-) Transcript_11724:134-775(-)|eukprot:CAMPEP_0119030750 /NCGR_PEP_ID=MMETSP1176-20130426/41191_1 /TAXON_ID=265551 /ORGANISM="Synedropsis recta cf, Strain CCMP1620" /LENGTH=213 /DNA_ID=CAMNT_0006987127 /DNA_START=74 /DNA_END=715 /DNA_ORIENTATION=-